MCTEVRLGEGLVGSIPVSGVCACPRVHVEVRHVLVSSPVNAKPPALAAAPHLPQHGPLINRGKQKAPATRARVPSSLGEGRHTFVTGPTGSTGP